MTAATRLLSHSQAARSYDVLGAGLGTQAFYEAAALHRIPTYLAQCDKTGPILLHLAEKITEAYLGSLRATPISGRGRLDMAARVRL
jgi:hypothetical protein